ncbi:serine hydrolase [Cutibacterium sp. WCA-380-WT-3A]|uniref:Serine hydrolase n=1 Tax=Cutibacterium porci TaxID=2605781 RepID=A0A7K0J5E2_9ACTN|nr:serine hydrolase [Cutibacterium porci]MSS45133.1 serine hydrolase [Cutibacterium porci]
MPFPYHSELTKYLKTRSGEQSVAMRVHGQRNIHVLNHGATTYITASIIKLAIMETVMIQAAGKKRQLTEEEKDLLVPMIENSSNDAATALWRKVGKADGVRTAMRRMGATHTTFDPQNRWGLTSTTAADQVVLADHIFCPNTIIPASMRAYARKLMSNVEDDQDWGMTAGMATPFVKNGWLPRDDGWHVNSVASTGVNGYTAVGLAHSSTASMDDLVETIEGMARIIARHQRHNVTASSSSARRQTDAPASQTVSDHGHIPVRAPGTRDVWIQGF